MSDLDDVIQSSQNEIDDSGSTRPRRIKPDHIRHRNYKIPILVISAVVVAIQWNTVQSWIFGIPEDTIQSDIVTLLKNSDDKVQDIFATTGEIPTALPDEMPSWLLGYKKTLAGYEINADIDGVLVKLQREGDSVKIQRQ